MPRHRTAPQFPLIAAAVAVVLALVGALIIGGAGSTPLGQIMAVLVGFLVLGAGAGLGLSMVAR